MSSVECLMIILPFSSSLVPSIEFFIQCQCTSICSELIATKVLIESNYSLSHLSKEKVGMPHKPQHKAAAVPNSSRQSLCMDQGRA